MAYVTITAGQVDADSPLDSTLFGQIKANFDAHQIDKLERDGTIPMTGSLDMGTNAIIGVTSLDGTGDLTMGTITLTAGSGSGIDANGKDIVCENITINGTMTTQNLTTSMLLITMAGDSETAAVGVLKDSANDLPFTTHLTATSHYVWIPDVSGYGCFFVESRTDNDNLDLADSTFAAKNARDYGNGNRYMIVEQVGGWIVLDSFSSGAFGGGDIWTKTIIGDGGGVKRSWILVKFSYQATGTRVLTITYGGSSIEPVNSSTNATDEYFMFAMKDGSNDMVFNWDSNITSFTAEISIDHVQRFSQAAPPGA